MAGVLVREAGPVSSDGVARGPLRRPDAHRVSPFELFFDLVFVFAVTQLSHHLRADLSLRGSIETCLLLFAVWSAWSTTTWVANWFDPDRLSVRLMLVGIMLGSLYMSAAIPEAFAGRGLLFAAAYSSIQVGRALFGAVRLAVLRGASDPLSRVFQRTLSWHVFASAFWIGGGVAHGAARYVLWGIAAGANYAGPALGHYTPGLGRTPTRDWPVAGEHLAERCQLFVLLALGDSLLVMGGAFAEAEASASTLAAAACGLLLSLGLWWVYFDRSAQAASDQISSSEDPGRIGRSAYSYLHVPMVAGIIAVAAATEVVVEHPPADVGVELVALTLGGVALFVAGHALFERVVFGRLPRAHVAALAGLAVVAPLATAVSMLALAALAAGFVLVLAVFETLSFDRANREVLHA
jgi:low temperature requirement protein LtrA